MPLKTMRDEIPAINLAPMIDIVFLLIIFFMVSSRFTERDENERDAAIQVPKVGAMPATAETAAKRIVNVFGDGQIKLDGESVSLDELGRRLRETKAQNPRAAVVVRGDHKTMYQSVADVISVCRTAGIQDVNLAVRIAQREP
jgi:biopolymer transport protein ExbD